MAKRKLQAAAIFLLVTIKLLLVGTCYFMISYLSSNYLINIYGANMLAGASFPSSGFLVISTHLFWFVLFMIPSYSFQRFYRALS